VVATFGRLAGHHAISCACSSLEICAGNSSPPRGGHGSNFISATSRTECAVDAAQSSMRIANQPGGARTTGDTGFVVGGSSPLAGSTIPTKRGCRFFGSFCCARGQAGSLQYRVLQPYYADTYEPLCLAGQASAPSVPSRKADSGLEHQQAFFEWPTHRCWLPVGSRFGSSFAAQGKHHQISANAVAWMEQDVANWIQSKAGVR
jgi:hypothetical protein